MDLNNFDLIPVKSVTTVKLKEEETLYDITIGGDHTFFIKLSNIEDKILVHNCDGSHITSMLIGWFKRFAPNLFNEGRICKLITPLVITVDKSDNIVDYFFNLDDFKAWESSHKNNKNKIIYLKGLGSWERSHLISLIDNSGLDAFIQEFVLDEDSDNIIDDWLGDDSEKRKAYLRAYDFDINTI